VHNPTGNLPPNLVVIGSLNMDLVFQVVRLPVPGETIHGQELKFIPGGKGANQAVAAARLGGASTLIGRVGDDPFGEQLLRNLQSNQVNVRHVTPTPHCPSGVALISVDHSGQNSITIISGANGRVTPQDLLPLETVISQADVVVLQLEIPLETVEAALALARKHHVPTILDPAPVPAGGFPADLYAVDILTPNQSEAELLTGTKITHDAAAEQAARILLERGARQVVLKMGAAGALLASGGDAMERVNAFAVTVVDTTAAGDAFTAGLALQHARGVSLREAVEFACAAGSLATTKLGAQPSMPSREEVLNLLNQPNASITP